MSNEPEMPGMPMGDARDIRPLLEGWELEPSSVTARRVFGEDGSEQVQLRIPMGLLQVYVEGRPDGARPGGFASVLELLRHQISQEKKEPTSEQWFELDREIMQYYHRRIAMLQMAEEERREQQLDLAAKDYARVVLDADHNLEVMDFIKEHNTDTEFVGAHEQYRSFVMGHRTLGAGLYWICRSEPEEALDTIQIGLKRLEQAYEERGNTDVMRRDPTAGRLVRLAEQLRKDHTIVKTLHEQLSEAVETEDFERAANLRDQVRERAARLRGPFKA